VIFPEETRSRDGHLLPFKTGGIVLAIQAGADIIPVGIRGAYDVRCRGSWLVRPGKIRVHYGAKIACSEFDLRDRKELVQAVRERVADLSGQSA
jgi:1-acyl-sn-glycerol-3-phosphate acyltransferase